MSPDLLLGLGLLAGHATLLVWLLNVTHSCGGSERILARVKLAWLGVAVGLSVLVARAVGPRPLAVVAVARSIYGALCLVLGLIVLPLATLALRLRAAPEGIVERHRGRELDLARAPDAPPLIGPGPFAWLLRVPGNESLRLRLREWELTVPTLPPAWDGLSLVHVSDLHVSPCYTRAFFERVLDEAAGWDADLVLFTGDLIDHDSAHPWIAPLMARLRGRLGSFAILGNHDLMHEPGRIARSLEEAGFVDLEGRWTEIPHAGGRLAIGGTSYPWGPRLDPAAAPADADFRVVLSHSPDQFPRLARWGVDLVLSGHNHGGQVRFPVLGPMLMPSRYSRRYDRGFFRRGRTLMHVSQGVAGKHPIRFGCTPEISRLVLRTGIRTTKAQRTQRKTQRREETMGGKGI